MRHRLLLLALLLLWAVPGLPESSDKWQTSLDLRYRLERVDDDRFSPHAAASTLRLRAGFISPSWSGWQIAATAQGNRHIGAQKFNSTANGRADYPVVADPDDENVAEAWVGYTRPGELFVRAGRQAISLGNQRFLGSGDPGHRQLQQTFDAVRVGLEGNAWNASLNWLNRAHRANGRSNPNRLLARADLDAWLSTFDYSPGRHTVGVYAHHIEFRDRPASHRNLGAFVTGPLPLTDGLTYRLEYAHQKGIRESRSPSGQSHVSIRVQQQLDGWHWLAGHERLGGNGRRAFQTPLATLHAFNGWGDQFATTPDDGLLDTYLAAGSRINRWRALARVHDFRSDRGSYRYGRELDLMLGRGLSDNLDMEIKAAFFDGAGTRASVSKIWLALVASW
ncbi:MAG TPA: hypothetical protein VK036_05425 [Wenzhouxiangella sp.]|nr:hypothetical protein [Wenzhouxiangella sp.]